MILAVDKKHSGGMCIYVYLAELGSVIYTIRLKRYEGIPLEAPYEITVSSNMLQGQTIILVEHRKLVRDMQCFIWEHLNPRRDRLNSIAFSRHRVTVVRAVHEWGTENRI